VISAYLKQRRRLNKLNEFNLQPFTGCNGGVALQSIRTRRTQYSRRHIDALVAIHEGKDKAILWPREFMRSAAVLWRIIVSRRELFSTDYSPILGFQTRGIDGSESASQETRRLLSLIWGAVRVFYFVFAARL
jgi:hypothetical protein